MIASWLILMLVLAACGLVLFVGLFVLVYAVASSSGRRGHPRTRHRHQRHQQPQPQPQPQRVHHQHQPPPPSRPRPSSSMSTWVGVGFAAVIAVALLPVLLYSVRSSRVEMRSRSPFLERVDVSPARRTTDGAHFFHSKTTGISSTKQALEAPVTREEVSDGHEVRIEEATPPFTDSETAPKIRAPGAPEKLTVRLADPLEAWDKASEISPAEQREVPRDKLWVLNAAGSRQGVLRDDDLVSIHGRNPGPGGQLVGYSAWNASAEEARIEAVQSATDQLGAVLLGKLAERASQDRQFDLRDLDFDLGELPGLIENRVGGAGIDPFVRERFSEEIKRDYGTLHRAAVRIEVSDEAFGKLTDELVRDVRVANVRVVKGRNQRLWTTLAAIGMALVAFLLYSFFNAGTKGYFAWPLRIISLATLAVLYAGLFFLRGWIG